MTAVYGPAALALVPGDNVAAYLTDALSRPETYRDAVLQTRSHLARHHSYPQRLQQLDKLVEAAWGAEPHGEHPVRDETPRQRGQAPHAVANYMQIAPKYGHSVAIYGTPYGMCRSCNFPANVRNSTGFVYLFESELYHIKPLREVAMLAAFPRAAPG